jgi:hypothetical protein
MDAPEQEGMNMTKFYLDVEGGGQVARDDFGIEVENLSDARRVAEALLANKDRASAASQYPIESVVVMDENGDQVLTVRGATQSD